MPGVLAFSISRVRVVIKGEVETLARTYTVEALETLADLMRNGSSDIVRAAAANALLNRGWGLPRQAIDGFLALRPEPKPLEQMSLAELDEESAMLREKLQLTRMSRRPGMFPAESHCSEPQRLIGFPRSMD
jgi:hypothetical protein